MISKGQWGKEAEEEDGGECGEVVDEMMREKSSLVEDVTLVGLGRRRGLYLAFEAIIFFF